MDRRLNASRCDPPKSNRLNISLIVSLKQVQIKLANLQVDVLCSNFADSATYKNNKHKKNTAI